MSIIHLTESNFDEEVMKSDKPVIVDFWATWCGPCNMVAPIVEELASEQNNVKICKVDVDEQQELAARFSVMSIPTFVAFKNGQVIKRQVGVHSKKDIIGMAEA